MLCQRPVTGFAVYMCVLTLALHIQHVGVARLAGWMPGKFHRARRDLGDSVRSIVAKPSKALGNHIPSNHQKDDESEDEQPRESE